MQLRDKYIQTIKEKSKRQNMSIEEFERQIFPQEATKVDNLLFCCFNIPIAFQNFNIYYENKKIIIKSDVSIITDLIKENAVILYDNSTKK